MLIGMFARSPYATLQHFLNTLGSTATELYEEEPADASLFPVSQLDWSRALQKGFGHTHLYSHQAESYRLMRQGKNLIITTPTASGKTGAFFPAIFEHLEQHSHATALFVYPLVALGQDQHQKLQEFREKGAFTWQVGVFQGNTRPEEVFSPNVRMVASNPDKLHWYLHHSGVQQFLANLQFLVLDEAHTYRGGFGSEVACLMKRLLMLSKNLGANPQIVMSTATIGNPREFASELSGAEAVEISRSGAQKHGKKYFLIDHQGQPRHFWDSVVEGSLIYNKKILVFFRSRSKAYNLHHTYSQVAKYRNFVHLYMSGTRDRDRRLSNFRQAQKGVMFATNALEAGIDIGDLEVVIIDGYPNSRMSFRQMAGRAGRIEKGIVLYIPATRADGVPNPLDAFYSNRYNFREMMIGAVEKAVIDAENEFIAPKHYQRHLYEVSVANSHPITTGRQLWNLRGTDAIKFAVITEEDWLNARNEQQQWHTLNDKALDMPSQHYAWMEKHPEALFYLDDKNYEVMRWQEITRRNGFEKIVAIICREIQPSDLLTRGIYDVAVKDRQNNHVNPISQIGTTKNNEMSELDDLGDLENKWQEMGNLSYLLKKATIEREYSGYVVLRRIFTRACVKCDRVSQDSSRICAHCGGHVKDQMKDQKISQYIYDHPVKLDPLQTYTLEVAIKSEFTENPEAVAHTLKHLLHKLIPEQISCDVNDLASTFNKDSNFRFFLYDDWQGGLGICRRAYENMPSLLRRAYQLATQDCCEDGCYACIQVGRCSSPYLPSSGDTAPVKRPVNKKATAQFLEAVLADDNLLESNNKKLQIASMCDDSRHSDLRQSRTTHNERLQNKPEQTLHSPSSPPLQPQAKAPLTQQGGQHRGTPNDPPPLAWQLQARKLFDIDGLNFTEISARLGVPSREIQRAISVMGPLRLRHPKFGEGMFLHGEFQGEKRQITVHFDRVGPKKLLVAFAKLDVIRAS